MSISTWSRRISNTNRRYVRRQAAKSNLPRMAVLDKVTRNGKTDGQKRTSKCVSTFKRAANTEQTELDNDHSQQPGTHRQCPPVKTHPGGAERRYRLSKTKAAGVKRGPTHSLKSPGPTYRVRRDSDNEPLGKTVATRSLEELLQVATYTAANAELAVQYTRDFLSKVSEGVKGGDGMRAAVQAAAAASAAARLAAMQAYDALQQATDEAQKNHYQDMFRSAFHRTLLQAAIANYLASRADQALNAVREAAKTEIPPGDALARFIVQETNFMMVKYGAYHPTPEEVAEIEALATAAKLALEQPDFTVTANRSENRGELSQGGSGWKDVVTMGMTVAAEGTIGIAGAFAAYAEGNAEAAGGALVANESAVRAAVEVTAAIGEALSGREMLDIGEAESIIDGSARRVLYSDTGWGEETAAGELRQAAQTSVMAAEVNPETGERAPLGNNTKDIVMRGKTTGDAAHAQHVAKVAKAQLTAAKATLENAMLRSQRTRFAATEIALQAATAKSVLKDYLGMTKASESVAQRLTRIKSLHNEALQKLIALRRALGTVDEAEAVEAELRERVAILSHKAQTETKEAADRVRDEIVDLVIQGHTP